MGAFGPRIVQGGDGTAENCFLEIAHLIMQHCIEAVQFAANQLDWHLMITYNPLPDVAGHAWVGLVDSVNGNYDPKIAQKIWPYITAFYQLADQHLGAVMSQSSPDVTIAVVSDHGMRGYRKIFSPKRVLRDAGLLSTVGTEERIIEEESKAYPEAYRNYLFIRINKAFVPAKEEQQVAEQVIEALLNAKDPDINRSIVTAVIDLERLGPSIGLINLPSKFYIVVKPGYMCADIAPNHRGYVQKIPLTAMDTAEHTSLPDDPAMHAIFYLYGPGVKKNQKDLMPFRSIDIAPTICHLLGLPPPAQAIGRVVNEILE
jgi:predicted AlkP superfamily phosphohydrolase/phosphomutase